MHQDGDLKWEKEDLARHFASTEPGPRDLENTRPPLRDAEDLLAQRP